MRNKKVCILIICIFVIAYILSGHFIQIALVQGDSMASTLKNGQFVLLNKMDCQYEVGDIVAFRCKDLNGLLIKRIIAKPGDCVVLDDNGLYVNQNKITDEFTKAHEGYSIIKTLNYILDEDEFFVLGDNRDNSIDSRYKEVGIVQKKSIIGKVVN